MLTIIGAIRGTARENQELVSRTSLESLKDRIWQRRLYYLHKILSAELPPPLLPPSNLYDLTPPLQRSHRNPGCLKALQCRTERFQNLFSPYSVNNWNKLDISFVVPRKLLEFIRPMRNSNYRIHDPIGIKLLKNYEYVSVIYENIFPDTLNPLCAYAIVTACIEHTFLCCHNYISFRKAVIIQLHDTD